MTSQEPSKEYSWAKISPVIFWGTLGGFVLMLIILSQNKVGFVPLLDHVNLVFHEAGHMIYGLLGEAMHWYGGTLGQLTFPVIIAGRFYLKREPVGFAVGVFWFFENFLNIAHYMADARTRQLHLVGGGLHDWTEIFSRWHALHINTQIADWVRTIGWIGMIGITIWFYLNRSISQASANPNK